MVPPPARELFSQPAAPSSDDVRNVIEERRCLDPTAGACRYTATCFGGSRNAAPATTSGTLGACFSQHPGLDGGLRSQVHLSPQSCRSCKPIEKAYFKDFFPHVSRAKVALQRSFDVRRLAVEHTVEVCDANGRHCAPPVSNPGAIFAQPCAS